MDVKRLGGFAVGATLNLPLLLSRKLLAAAETFAEIFTFFDMRSNIGDFFADDQPAGP